MKQAFLPQRALFLLMLTITSCTDDSGSLIRLRKLEIQVETHPESHTAFDQIASYATSWNFVTRANAITILGNLSESHPELSAKVARVALGGLDDRDHAVKVASVKALGQVMPRFAIPAIPQLRRDLSQGDNDLSWSAAKTLGHLRLEAKEAVPDLIKALHAYGPARNDGSPQLCEFAAEALGNIGTPAVAAILPLKDALASPDADFKQAAEIAIRKISSDIESRE